MTEQVVLEFVNTEGIPPLPMVALLMDGTNLVVATSVDDGDLRDDPLLMARVMTILEGIFGITHWRKQDALDGEGTELLGTRFFLTSGAKVRVS